MFLSPVDVADVSEPVDVADVSEPVDVADVDEPCLSAGRAADGRREEDPTAAVCHRNVEGSHERLC